MPTGGGGRQAAPPVGRPATGQPFYLFFDFSEAFFFYVYVLIYFSVISKMIDFQRLAGKTTNLQNRVTTLKEQLAKAEGELGETQMAMQAAQAKQT